MDDDLMSLRGSGSSPTGGGSSMPNDNPLGLGLDDFVPAPPKPAEPEPSFTPASASVAAPASKSAPSSPKKKAAPKRAASSGGGGGFLGMTPQQGMLLSIFLFLDVAVLGCLVLVALGYRLPGM